MRPVSSILHIANAKCRGYYPLTRFDTLNSVQNKPPQAGASPESGDFAHSAQHAKRIIVLTQAHQLAISNSGYQHVVLLVGQPGVFEYRRSVVLGDESVALAQDC